MLRAAWLALKAYYAAHPGEPFDHEKHMPTHMKEARSDPATWASGSGAGGSGAGGSGDSDAHHVRLSPRAAPNPRARPTTCSRAPTHARASPVCTRPTD